ncbi:hypothetical protein EKE48_23095 [Salmonella enterica]|nr:hypothetical protein [Salmonella enterica]
MLINQILPWVTVCIFVASLVLFARLLKHNQRIWTRLVALLVLAEELILSLWLLAGDVQILSPHVMGGV